jgi:hypothetical protein
MNANLFRRELILAAAGVSIGIVGFSAKAWGDTPASWAVTSGNWSNPANWASNPYYPNDGNPAGSLYDVLLQGGTATLDVSPTIEKLTLSAGTITGSNTLTVAGQLQWFNGTLSNSSTFADGGLSMPLGIAYLSGGSLTTAASTTVSIGFAGQTSLALSNGATLNNAASLTASSGSIYYSDTGALTTINNSGSFTVNDSGGKFTLGYSYFKNTGSLDVAAGTLDMFSYYTGSTGSIDVSPGATFIIEQSFAQTPSFENDGLTDFYAVSMSSGNITGAGTTNLGAGKLKINASSGASSQDALTINNGTLDLTNNSFYINYGSNPDPISQIAGYIDSGYDGGTWKGAGITSSTAQTNSASYGIGYADSADPGNPAGLSRGTIEIKYTLLGDANLDGKVNGADFTLMAASFNDSVTNGWDEGDFNYDGKVNGNDFVLLADNFNQFASQSAVSAADLIALNSFAAANGLATNVPEPLCISSAAFAAALSLRWRRQRLD